MRHQMFSTYQLRYKFTLLIFVLVSFSLSAQSAIRANGDRTPGYWTLGLNAGLSYQGSDVATQLEGFGLGLTLAKNLYYAPNSPLAFDLRGRFLYAKQYGLDGIALNAIGNDEALNGTNGPNYVDYPANLDITDGFVFANHQTQVAELALEGVLSFNRLRERTGVYLGLYGGIGVDWYRTKLNQLDANGDPYYTDYANLVGQSKSDVRQELKNAILDDTYETNAHDFKNGGKLGFMPSVGIELGYQLTPRFSVILGHRVTFSGTDILDGQGWTSPADNDIYHYTNLGFRWILDPGTNKGKAPEIVFEHPSYSPHPVKVLPEVVRANISNVSSKYDVEATLNGQAIDFDFGSSGTFRRIVNQLRSGENNFTISAKNSYGSDRETMILIYEDVVSPPPPPPHSGPAPVVSITSPTRNPLQTTLSTETLIAFIENVSSRNQISVRHNNRDVAFTYDSRAKRINTTLNLSIGRNTVIVSAENTYGEDQEHLIINYTQQSTTPDIPPPPPNQDRPFVNITRPTDNSISQQSTTSVEAQVEGVNHKNNIRVFVNGDRLYDFTYNSRQKNVRANVSLRNGNNTVRIEAENNAGQAQDGINIRYQAPAKPSVSISQPTNNSTVNQSSVQLVARTQNVNNRNQITVKLNNRVISNFELQNGVIRSNLNLNPGNNNIDVQVNTDGGSDNDRVSVDFRQNNRPSVNITQPTRNPYTSSTAQVQIKATVQQIERSDQITVRYDGQVRTDFAFNPIRQEINFTVQLTPGQHNVRIRVQNNAGQAEDDIELLYQPTARPNVTISQPANNSEVNQPSVQLIAPTENVTNRNQVTVRLNNQNVNNFEFQDGTIKSNLTLNSGRNTIVVRVSTDGGSDEEQVRVTYRNTPAPTVQIQSPQNNATLESANINLIANITGVSNQRDLAVYVNDRQQRGFTFQNNRIEAPITLREGSNNIRVTARNSAGNAEDAITVNHRVPTRQIPVIRFTNPGRPGGSVNNKFQSITANVQYVNNKDQIDVKVNGRSLSNFVFNRRANEVTFPLTLREGSTSITISATNNDGTADATTSLNYTPPASGPTVSIVSISRPVENPLFPGVGASTLNAQITGATSANQVQVLVNGDISPDFNFNSTTGTLNTTVQLTSGENVIVVRVTTNEGSAEDSQTMDF